MTHMEHICPAQVVPRWPAAEKGETSLASPHLRPFPCTCRKIPRRPPSSAQQFLEYPPKTESESWGCMHRSTWRNSDQESLHPRPQHARTLHRTNALRLFLHQGCIQRHFRQSLSRNDRSSRPHFVPSSRAMQNHLRTLPHHPSCKPARARWLNQERHVRFSQNGGDTSATSARG